MIQPILRAVALTVLAATFANVSTIRAANNEGPAWKPVKDEVFLQEVGRQVPTSHPLTSVAVFEGSVYAGSDQGLFKLQADQLIPIDELSTPIRRLVTTSDAMWAITGKGLYRL